MSARETRPTHPMGRSVRSRAAALFAQAKTAGDGSQLGGEAGRPRLQSGVSRDKSSRASPPGARAKRSSASVTSAFVPSTLAPKSASSSTTLKRTKRTRAPLGPMRMFAGGKWRRERTVMCGASASGGRGVSDTSSGDQGKEAAKKTQKVYRCPLCPNEPPYA